MRTLHTLLAVAGTVAAVALPGSAAALTDPGGSPAGRDAAPAARTALKQDTAFAGADLQPVAGRDNIYYLKAKHSGKCLTVRGASHANNAVVNQYRCVSGAKNQWWIVYDGGGLARRFTNFESQKCLSLKGGRTAKGTPAVQRDCEGTPDQIWYTMPPYREGEMSRSGGAGCLDVQGASKADNAPVILWKCNSKSNQKWAGVG
ncbi:RICIN domain-containing protein [Streptomyces huasconensis]|uniref:RICIN domain-containing protein n=1 Tax=Streptomyces huasconensis TaxID=1854574 RepID=UPI0036F548C4